MRTKLVFTVSCALITLCVGGASAAGCSSDDPVIPSPPDGGAETSTTPPPPPNDSGPSGLGAVGTSCTSSTACQSGHCVDGVCCESACDGTCESCKLPGSLGKCEPVPDGQDPDTECKPGPLPDAGSPDPVDAGDGDAGAEFVVPDGGLPAVNDNQCAGHCNGKRACAFAGTDVTCGTAFCGNTTQEGRATCDGKGHCLYGVKECSAYACPDGSPGCKESCLAPSDCLATHYCDGATNTCKPKLGDGTNCSTANECQSNVCDTTGGAGGVCCNIDCTTTPGGTCRKAGSVGTCQCDACPTGACAVFYRDEDGDGFGDKNGVPPSSAGPGNGRAVYACADGSNTPAGFVADNTDCLDSALPIAAQVRPNQTGWFTAAYTNSAGAQSFDYNCSGTVEKEIFEGGCGFCRNLVFIPLGGEAEPEPEPLMSEPEGLIICPRLYFSTTCPSTTSAPARSCPCGAKNDAAFTNPVACGTPALSTTCTSCTAAGGTGGTASAGTKTQRCH
ncbi:MAG: hypothetical protein KIT84_14430 [Labilithrix sp.]|nr:hypothetical protein [Labilithrix sp.]